MPVAPERLLPDWFRVPAPGSPNYLRLRNLVRDGGLHTVCEEAHCPNIGDCWERGNRHLHDSRRHLHVALPLLRRDHRPPAARLTPTSPRASPRPSGSSASVTASSLPSPERTSPTAARPSSRSASSASTTPSPAAPSRCSSPTSRATTMPSAPSSTPAQRS